MSCPPSLPPHSNHFGIPTQQAFNPTQFKNAIEQLLSACGIDTKNAHMHKTAQRVCDLWEKRLLGGYETDPGEVLGQGFEDPREDVVLIKGIAVHGICPHHLVPFKGLAHVAYIPGGRLHGFGGIARMVDALGHRFTYQEWLTRDIADAMVEFGKAKGAACVLEAEQLCLLLGEDRRGDEQVCTQAFSGIFQESESLRNEFFSLLKNP